MSDVATTGPATTCVDRLWPPPQWIGAPDDHSPNDRAPDHHRPEGYRLDIVNGVATIDAFDDAGRRHGTATLAQLQADVPTGQGTRGGPVQLSDLCIVDWPDIPSRGAMFDISRGKVPTMITLERLIEQLASLKMNVCCLYIEHTFAHPGHEVVWADASPLTADELASLTAFGSARGVDVVVQFNAPGHMERWLRHEPYAQLAALPGGYRNADGGAEPPACLEPTNPNSFDLVEELWNNIAPHGSARRAHIGMDEPIDLNPAVWDAIFDYPDPPPPPPWADVDNGAFCVPLPPDRLEQYRDWANRLATIPALDGRELLMWADVVAPHPDLARALDERITLVEWGYEADHPFAARCGRLAAAGRTFWTAPGTSSWSSITGRPDNCAANISDAAQATIDLDGAGLLVCDWGNDGHFQYLPISYVGIVGAAGHGWNHRVAERAALVGIATAIDDWMMDDWARDEETSSLGATLIALGRCHDAIEPSVPEAGSLASLLTSPHAALGFALRGVSLDMFDEADRQLSICQRQLSDVVPSQPIGSDSSLIIDELVASAEWLRLGIAVARWRLDHPLALGVEEIIQQHDQLVSEHQRLWLARNRPGGLQQSVDGLCAVISGLGQPLEI